MPAVASGRKALRRRHELIHERPPQLHINASHHYSVPVDSFPFKLQKFSLKSSLK